jgi:signal peptidase I
MSELKNDNPEAKSNFKTWAIENLRSLVIALAVVFAIRSSIVEPFKIPSGSMIPTLFIGDFILVNKFAYGLKVPYSEWLLDEPIYIFKREPPKRGDIIVFKFPKDESMYYIKRVVGIPGDKVEIKNKQIYINDEIVKRTPMSPEEVQSFFKENDDPRYTPSDFQLFYESLGEKPHKVMIQNHSYGDEDRGPFRIPEDQLFVMGDNRDYSNDSRFWGTVPYKNVKGRAFLIVLSFWFSQENGIFFHPERIGTVLK